MRERRWPFVVIEGGDGAGTTTQARILGARLSWAFRRPVRVTAEPSRSEIGALCRLIVQDRYGVVPWQAQMHLFLADRALHVAHEIRPAVEDPDGAPVVCDRYAYSTAVYQGIQAALEAGDGPRDAAQWGWEILAASAAEPGWLAPDLAILVDVDAAVAAARRAARGGQVEAFDGHDMQAAVLDGYRALWAQLRTQTAAAAETRYVQVDGNGAPEDVAEAIWQAVAPLVSEGPAISS